MTLSLEIPGMKRLRIDSDEDDDCFIEQPRSKKSPDLDLCLESRPSPHVHPPEDEIVGGVSSYSSVDEMEVWEANKTPLLKNGQTWEQQPSESPRPFSDVQRERFDCIMESLKHDSTRAFMVDLFDFLQHCVSQNTVMNLDIITELLRLPEDWFTIKSVHSLHRILRQDLKLREPPLLNMDIVDELKRYINKGLQYMRESTPSVRHHGTPSSANTTSLQLHVVQLMLNYFTKLLMKYIDFCATSDSIGRLDLITFTTKYSFFIKIIELIFIISEEDLSQLPSCSVLAYHNLRDDLFTLLCVPLTVPTDVPQTISTAQTIAGALEERLRKTNSVKIRRHVISNIPSYLLKQLVIDLHIEKEFKFHSSIVENFTAEFLTHDRFNLSKFCCIHLCRVPYHHDGSQHDLSYFLYLLYTLLESHLLLITGIQPVSYLTPNKTMKKIPNGFKQVLMSVKPHIAGLVDRISEDEMLLIELTNPVSWNEMQSLSNVVETVMAVFT